MPAFPLILLPWLSSIGKVVGKHLDIALKALLQLVLRIRASHWYKGVPQSPRLRFSRSDAG